MYPSRTARKWQADAWIWFLQLSIPASFPLATMSSFPPALKANILTRPGIPFGRAFFKLYRWVQREHVIPARQVRSTPTQKYPQKPSYDFFTVCLWQILWRCS